MNINQRWWLALYILAFVVGALLYAEPRGFSVRGLMTATDQEAQEGYFAVGRELTIVTKPGSTIHDDLKAMAGAEVTVVVTTR